MTISKSFLAMGILAGTIIGAGVFSLPYIFAQVGLASGIVFLAAITAVIALLHLFYADLFTSTGGRHNFVGLLKIYFGKTGAIFGAGIIILQVPLVLVIYLVLVQSFINLIISDATLVNVLLFWGLGSAVIFSYLNRMAWLEFLAVVGMVGIVLLIFVFAFPSLLSVSWGGGQFGWDNFFLPIGPLFFALAGTSAVVHVVRELKKKSQSIKKAVIWGTVAPAIIYLFFIIAVSVLSGVGISPDAVSGLIGFLPAPLLVMVGFLGWLSLWTSYVAIGFDTNDILKTDLEWAASFRVLYLVVLPLALYLFGWRDFIGLVSFVGAVFTPLVGILIIAVWLKIKRRQGEMVIFKKMPLVAIIVLALFLVVVLVDQIVRIIM